MVNYKLNEEADKDLDRLYEYGVLSFGLDQADRYYEGLIERFYELVDNPKLWQAVDYIRTGYRLMPVIRFIIVLMEIQSKLCGFWENKTQNKSFRKQNGKYRIFSAFTSRAL